MFSKKLFVVFATKFYHYKNFFAHNSFYFNYVSEYTGHGSQNFTHLIFSINLGRFEKRLRTTGLLHLIMTNNKLNVNLKVYFDRTMSNVKHLCKWLLTSLAKISIALHCFWSQPYQYKTPSTFETVG